MTHALSGELSFATATATLDQTVKPFSAGGAGLVLDLSGVTRADSAGLALLLELARLARENKTGLQIANAPPQLRQLAEFFGLSGLLPFAA